MAKNNSNAVTVLALLITAGLFTIGAGLIWLGFVLTKSNSVTPTPSAGSGGEKTVTSSAPAQAINTTTAKVDYSKLEEYLQQKDWRSADRET